MSAQYSDSSTAILAVDTASPRISVAIGRAGRSLAVREAASGRASPSLLGLIDGLLAETGIDRGDLGGLIGVRGPGSFTGLRVGLATLLGMHRTLGVPAAAISTFAGLAWQARAADGPVLAVVDALRGEWFTQLYEPGEIPDALEQPTLRGLAEIGASGARSVVGFGLDALTDGLDPLVAIEAQPLAPFLIERAAAGELAWDPMELTEPLYLRPAATTPPKRRPATP